jgi:hypothetical protein
MSKVILFVFPFFPFILFSQIKITNESLVYPEKRILYLGVVNSIEVNDADSLELTIVDSGKDTVQSSGTTFFYKPKREDEFDTLTLLYKGKVIDTAIFKVKVLNKAQVFLGDTRDTTVSKDYILSNPGLRISFYPSILECWMYINQYDASLIKKNGDEIPLTGVGSKFSNENLKILEEAEHGDELFIKYITFISPASSLQRRAVHLKMTIVE